MSSTAITAKWHGDASVAPAAAALVLGCLFRLHAHPGISAVQLQRQLGIKKVDSAWYLLHRLRRGMVRQNRERLSGTVEADEAHIGGPVKGKAGRGVAKARTKTLIAGAVEIVTYTKGGNFREKAGRLRLAILKDAGENEIKAFLNRHVAEGSQIKSDGWKGYSAKALAGYKHLSRVQGDQQVLASTLHTSIERSVICRPG